MGADPDLVAAVRRLRQSVRGHAPIERAIIFGSRARGDERADSDVDLLLVSAAFERKSAAERGAPIHLAWDLPVPIDLLCYSPAEFDRLRTVPSIVRVAIEEGTEIGA